MIRWPGLIITILLSVAMAASSFADDAREISGEDLGAAQQSDAARPVKQEQETAPDQPADPGTEPEPETRAEPEKKAESETATAGGGSGFGGLGLNSFCSPTRCGFARTSGSIHDQVEPSAGGLSIEMILTSGSPAESSSV